MRIKLRGFFPFSGRWNVRDFLLKCHCLIKLIVHIKKGTVEKVVLIIIIRIDFNIVSHWPHILANSLWPLATGQPSPRAFVSVNLLPTCLPPHCPQLSSQFSQTPLKTHGSPLVVSRLPACLFAATQGEVSRLTIIIFNLNFPTIFPFLRVCYYARNLLCY